MKQRLAKIAIVTFVFLFGGQAIATAVAILMMNPMIHWR